jgi:hypothetical protein
LASDGWWSKTDRVIRSLAMEFLAKLRTEVERILFFGLGLKIKASRDIRRRMVQALSRLGLKPKILVGRCKHKRMASGLVLRPKSWAKPKAGDDRASDPVLGLLSCDEQVSAIELVTAKASEKASEKARVSTSPSGSSELCLLGELSLDLEEVASKMDPILVPVPGKVAMNRSSLEFALVSLEFALVSPDMSMSSTELIALASPVVHSTILVALETTLSSPTMIDADFVLLGCTQTALVKSLTPFPMGSTQIVPSSPVVLRDGSDSASNLAVSEAQLLVNGLTEAQAWFLGWLRDGTRSQELLAAIDCFEVQTRIKNEGVRPPVYPMELSKLKAMLEAGIRDANRDCG